MEKIKELLLKLKSKYSPVLSLTQRLEQKYLSEPYDRTQIKCQNDSADAITETASVLTNDVEQNNRFLEQLIERADKIVKELEIEQSDSSSLKLWKEYKYQLDKIKEKNFESADKVAENICKCLKRTILKLYGFSDFGEKIDSYLTESGFQLISFEEGHKLSDDDLCYLDGNLLLAYKTDTNLPEKDYRVIRMIQPIIKIFYIDEDDDTRHSHYLPGTCRYFSSVKVV